ncbi:DUF6262 family protein [Leptolyngbya ohadii]|uniref:DUF6262 family protein n=1 Tax=Leptolyngbya ohadii TaxID=1962290 RepID=UPI000B598CA4|nr:DUF6262 family protein [Leptolyngbya ohadii]
MTQADLTAIRTENLKRAQAARKDETLERAYKAIEHLQKTGSKINFPAIAKVANVSVSYLYKYPELKQHIAELRNQQSAMPRKPLKKPTVSDSQTKVITRLKERVRQVEEQNRDLQHRNEALAGQVYRLHQLQAQVERQQQTIQDLEVQLQRIRSQPAPVAAQEINVTPITQAKLVQRGDLIEEAFKTSGVALTPTWNRILRQHDEQATLQAIQAYNQYRETHTVAQPAACLRRAIEQGWVPNQKSEPTTLEQDEFDHFYADATAQGFVLDIPKNHLPTQNGEILVKVNQPSSLAPWTTMCWKQAKAEYERSRH